MNYDVSSPVSGTISEVRILVGSPVAEGTIICYVESMKMEYEVKGEAAGRVLTVNFTTGSQISVGDVICTIESTVEETSVPKRTDDESLSPEFELLSHRDSLYNTQAARIRNGRRQGELTALERIELLFDDGSFEEYGRFAIAAQRRRRPYNELVERTQNDGVITGVGTVNGTAVATICYDYDVLAGTQGLQNHRKLDRILDIVSRRRLPLVTFADGGGGRPGDSDGFVPTGLEVSSFAEIAKLSKKVPHIAIVSGYTFAGNAALAAVADLIIGTDGLSMGMGGPAMIEGGGLGTFHPSEVGPIDVLEENGTIDIRAINMRGAIELCKLALGVISKKVDNLADAKTTIDLDHVVPSKRGRTFDLDLIIDGLVDSETKIELRPNFAKNLRVYLARIGGYSALIMANDSRHLAGAIDRDAAAKAIVAYRIANKFDLPIISFIDTPGFIVGPTAEAEGGLRTFGQLFIDGATCESEVIAVVIRRGYGLGAMAMTKGSFKEPLKTVSWPTGEFGGMGPEGAIRLGYRKELEAIADPVEREAKYNELLQALLKSTSALSLADAFEIDDVILPSNTRGTLMRLLEQLQTLVG